MRFHEAVSRRPLVAFFVGAYLLAAAALAVIGLPMPRHGVNEHPVMALIMFPVMVIGVGVLGVGLTELTAGRRGVRELASQFRRAVPPRWWLVAPIPPAAILAVLHVLRSLASPDYRPGFLIFGVAAGVASGFFEERGWTGFTFPRLQARFGLLGGGLVLGGLWGLWHLPVVDSLGAATPHGGAWPAFFAAFVAAVVALRVLIAWAYTNTHSLRLAQVLHASSTASLVVFGAPAVTPGQEALWYAGYAVVLWVVVALVLLLPLSRRHRLTGPDQRTHSVPVVTTADP